MLGATKWHSAPPTQRQHVVHATSMMALARHLLQARGTMAYMIANDSLLKQQQKLSAADSSSPLPQMNDTDDSIRCVCIDGAFLDAQQIEEMLLPYGKITWISIGNAGLSFAVSTRQVVLILLFE
jgi:hypothetical protein